MSTFLRVKSTREVLEIVRKFQPLGAETVPLGRAWGRVLAEPVHSREPVPHFPRATMDGYAVRARDSFGASENLPALLEVSGHVCMGEGYAGEVEPGKAVSIPTGGILPAGADAVVMIEFTHPLDETTIEVFKPVAPGENVLGIGEDIAEGQEVFPRGRRLRSQDVGVLAALGLPEIPVYRRPRVAVLSTGDEILPAFTRNLPPGKVRDINSFTLAAMVEESSAVVGTRGILCDHLDSLVSACCDALDRHEVLILSGGSSVGSRDLTIEVLERLADAQILVHGIAVRPGKPTILARVDDKLVWGLPGQPVSAVMIFQTFVRPSLERLQGLEGVDFADSGFPRPAVLNRRLPSVHGRTDLVPVILSREDSTWLATPVFGKSAMIHVLARSDGYVLVPEHVEGLDQGTPVNVYPYSLRGGSVGQGG